MATTTAPTISGQLRVSNPDAQISFGCSAYRPIFDYRETRELTNWMILFNSGESPESFKPENYSGSSEHYHYSGLTEHKHCLGSANEKGRTANPTLWGIYSCNYESIVVHISTYKNFVGQSSGYSLVFFRCLRLISPSNAKTIKPEVLSPSSFTDSIASTISCGTRAFKDCDFALTVPVAITYLNVGKWTTVYMKENHFKCLTWTTPLNKVDHTLIVLRSINGNVPEWWNTAETSIHNVMETYTMALQHSTQTRPEKKYLWRFLALNRSDINAKPCRISVEALTEHDARRVLARFYILSLSTRLSAQGVCNA